MTDVRGGSPTGRGLGPELAEEALDGAAEMLGAQRGEEFEGG